MVKHFTKEQRYTIIKCIKDCDLLGFSDKEGIKYIRDKIGKSISIMSYHRYKNKALKDTKYLSTRKWVSYQAKIGHIESYRKRLDEMELINQETLKLWYQEIRKEEKDQDKDFIIALIQLLQKNGSLLLQISFTTPVADFIRNNAIEQHKQIIELNQKYNDLVNHKDNKKEIKEEEQRVLEEYNYQKNNFIC